jgi:urocanate hydratase
MTAEALVLQVEGFYASLISSALITQRVPLISNLRAGISAAESACAQNQEPGLGGKLLYAGELDANSRALIIAANIAGAATLTTSADAEARKQAMRDGVVDFLVTTLDEALRILKNELRKREAVAVCVAQAPETVAREMLERGVLPDLLRPVERNAQEENQAILIWRVASAPSLWLPKIDGIVQDCLQQKLSALALDSETGESMRRWLRLAPRYLGRLTQGVRVLRCGNATAEALLQRIREAVESGEIGVAVDVNQVIG